MSTTVLAFADIDARTLHDVLKLRQDVFILEQSCVYPDLDGRDVGDVAHRAVGAVGAGRGGACGGIVGRAHPANLGA